MDRWEGQVGHEEEWVHGKRGWEEMWRKRKSWKKGGQEGEVEGWKETVKEEEKVGEVRG